MVNEFMMMKDDNDSDKCDKYDNYVSIKKKLQRIHLDLQKLCLLPLTSLLSSLNTDFSLAWLCFDTWDFATYLQICMIPISY